MVTAPTTNGYEQATERYTSALEITPRSAVLSAIRALSNSNHNPNPDPSPNPYPNPNPNPDPNPY